MKHNCLNCQLYKQLNCNWICHLFRVWIWNYRRTLWGSIRFDRDFWINKPTSCFDSRFNWDFWCPNKHCIWGTIKTSIWRFWSFHYEHSLWSATVAASTSNFAVWATNCPGTTYWQSVWFFNFWKYLCRVRSDFRNNWNYHQVQSSNGHRFHGCFLLFPFQNS